MSKGVTSAKQSVLLDYLSPWNVLVLPRAMASGHHTVALGIVGSLLLKLLVITSTGLFVSRDITFQRDLISLTKAFGVSNTFNPLNVDIRPLVNLEGANGTQRSYALGSTPEYTFQPFTVSSDVTLGRFSDTAMRSHMPSADQNTSTTYYLCFCRRVLVRFELSGLTRSILSRWLR